MKVTPRKMGLMEAIDLKVKVMDAIRDTDTLKMAWHQNKIISLTLPSKKLKYG